MSERSEYWLQHVVAVEREGISIRAYAAREKVSAWSIYERRRELRQAEQQAGPTAGPRRFVAVKVAAFEPVLACQIRVGERITLELSSLPAVSWLAALATALSPEAC